MAKVDELVVTVSADIDPSFDKTMKEAERAPKRAKGAVDKLSDAYGDSSTQGRKSMSAIDKLNKSYGKSSKALDITGKAAGSAVDAVTRLGIVSAATSSLMGAWSFNAAGNANKLDNMAFSTQLSTQELQEMSSAYRQLGLSADAFYQDAVRYQEKHHRTLDANELLGIADQVAGMDETSALQLLRGLEFSDASAKAIIRSGREGIQQAVEESYRRGHVSTEEQVNNLKDMHGEVSSLWDTLSATATAFQSGLSVGLVPALEELGLAFADNQNYIEEWGKGAGNAIKGFVDGATGNIRALDTVVRENGKTSLENIYSDDPEVRKREIDDLEQEAFWGSASDTFMRLAKTTPVYGLANYLVNGEGYDPIGAWEGYGNSLDRRWASYNRAIAADESKSYRYGKINRIGPSSFYADEGVINPEFDLQPPEGRIGLLKPTQVAARLVGDSSIPGAMSPSEMGGLGPQQMYEIPRSSSVYNNVINNAGDANSASDSRQTTTVHIGGIAVEVSGLEGVNDVVQVELTRQLQQVAAALPRRG